MNTLRDSFSRSHTYLRISITDRCNLHCVYCRPEGEISPPGRTPLPTSDEIIRMARIVVRMGVRKIRITGGEPLLRKDAVQLTARMAEIPGVNTLGMTTNGILLRQHAAGLRAAGLRLLNVSLDSLRPDRFRSIAGGPGLHAVLNGIDAALDAGFTPLKLNVVVMKGVNDDELADFVEFVRSRPVVVRFIEFMPFPSNRWEAEALVPYDEMKRRLERQYELVPSVRNSESDNEIRFRIPGFAGRVGFIASMTRHFCAGCNRVRIASDGRLKTCLFSETHVNLVHAMRSGASDEEISRLIGDALVEKPFVHASMEELRVADNLGMVRIGG